MKMLLLSSLLFSSAIAQACPDFSGQYETSWEILGAQQNGCDSLVLTHRNPNTGQARIESIQTSNDSDYHWDGDQLRFRYRTSDGTVFEGVYYKLANGVLRQDCMIHEPFGDNDHGVRTDWIPVQE